MDEIEVELSTALIVAVSDAAAERELSVDEFVARCIFRMLEEVN